MSVQLGIKSLALPLFLGVCVSSQENNSLLSCGDARYKATEVAVNGTPTLKCENDCYLPSLYGCDNDRLVQISSSSLSHTTTIDIPGNDPPPCSATPTTQYLSDPPYANYFYSDCHLAAQAVVTSPLSDSNLSLIGPRLIIAWPAGNSGVCAFFAPQNGINGSLAIELVNSTAGQALSPVYVPANGAEEYPRVGVSGTVRFNSSATLTVPILGSIRTIRDFTEGPSLLVPAIQNATQFNTTDDGGVEMSRLWLDNVTTTEFGFTPVGDSVVTVNNRTINFTAGDYTFYADFNYPQLTQLNSFAVLNSDSQNLITQQSDQTTSLQFLSYTEKLLAGAWRFLTYFGRDSMIATLLLQPVLSDQAIEAVIGAVLERINNTDGSVCHEETIGDYATYLNQMMNITEGVTNPSYSYVMIDSDYYLPVLMERYFLTEGNAEKAASFLNMTAGRVNPNNTGLTYGDLALLNAAKLMTIAGTYAAEGNQTVENLAHLKSGQIVGQWRDSTYGIGGGRIPYDVNTALMPAALRSIAALSGAGVYANHTVDWPYLAANYAQIWEDTTLQWFEVTIPKSEAQGRLQTYVNASSFGGTNQSDTVDDDITFHALSLDGNNNLSQVQVMNTDDCFRHFLLNTTNQTQLTSFINQTANNIRRTFPAGLLTDVGLLVANPAYGVGSELGGEDVYVANWTTSAYHGTVVWSWPMAMMARGLELQLSRCSGTNTTSIPSFCLDDVVYANVKDAYNTLWDTIEANSAHLSTEVWSWVFQDGEFVFAELGTLPPAPGTSPTESDIRQLWSLTFLAVVRDEGLR
ncbi:hypothetical protein P7C71_g5497, partial [Lecanoromycetidae sp. Uapishka_2]